MRVVFGVNVAILSVTVCVLSGCAPRLGGSDYDVRSVGELSESYAGTLMSKRVVRLNAKSSNEPGAGALVGAGAGAIAGSQIGKGKGQVVGALAGGLLAGVAGHLIEDQLVNQDGFEYTVQLDNGRLISVTQGAEPNLLVGQRVTVIQSQKGRSRVVPGH